MQLSVAARNARLDAIETTIGTAALFKIFDGTMPASCATADAGTALASFSLPSDYLANASSGAKSKSGTWSGSASATGMGRYFRMYDSGAAACHIQGLCGQNWAASTAFALNQHTINGGNVYKCTTAGTTAGSGGPTGTGTGITDGTAVWAYVGVADMTLDNSSIASAQVITASGFAITDGNA